MRDVDIIELVRDGTPQEDVISTIKSCMATSDEMVAVDRLQTALIRFMGQTRLPIRLQAGVIMTKLMDIYQQAMRGVAPTATADGVVIKGSDPDYSAARQALKEYWLIVKDCAALPPDEDPDDEADGN